MIYSLGVPNIWLEGKEERTTQLVFCDISTPNPDKFNVYDALRNMLVFCGIPEKEIKYIHAADTDAKKKALFDSVNAGQVRILFGSTEKMGAGTNVQRRLIALHHIDAPWRPRDIEQRDGRILRQGNTNEKVHIFRYVTEGSFDAYMWQTLENKARFIQQVITGKTSVREAEDVEGGALSFAEIKALASGNPMVLEKIRIDTEVRRFDLLRVAHQNKQYDISRQIHFLPKQIEETRQFHSGLLKDISTRDAHETDSFIMTINGREYSGKNAREQAGEAILQTITSSLWEEKKVKHLGHYKGFTLSSSFSGREEETPLLIISGTHRYGANLNTENPLGTISSIEYAIRNLDRQAQDQKAEYERKEKLLADYQEQRGRPFEHEERLRELFTKQQDMNRQLDLDKSDTQVVAETQEEEQHPTRRGRTIQETPEE